MNQNSHKYKDPSSMRLYLQLKSIKWGFKWWFCCGNSTCHLYKFDLYFGKTNNVEMILSESVALQLTKKLNGKYYILFFDTVL